VRTQPEVDGDRRVEGTLVAADEEGITVALRGSEHHDESDSSLARTDDRRKAQARLSGEEDAASGEPGRRGGQRRLAYDQIERARTVFEWGTPADRPGRPAASPRGNKKRERRS
jgi:hypothetical protein